MFVSLSHGDCVTYQKQRSLKIQREPEKPLTQHLGEKTPTKNLISPQVSFYSLCYLLGPCNEEI